MGSNSVAKRLWHSARVVYYMLRKGISKRKLMLDLHLLHQRGKLAGKAISNLMAFHPHHHHSSSGAATGLSAFSCRSTDPNLSYYNPRGVEFSCSNTPAYHPFYATKRKHRRNDDDNSYYNEYDADSIAKVFEILNAEVSEDTESVVASPSPSPAPLWSYGKSPAPVRQLRITDSPFLQRDEEGESDGHVDREAEEFIKRFYDQLRQQKLAAAATPDYAYHRRAGTPLLGRA